MNTLVRDLQIDLILGNKNPIIDIFNNICNGLSIITTEVYHKEGGEIIYYNSENEWVFFRDDNKNRFWCNHERYWGIFSQEFEMNRLDIKKITKLLLENTLNIDVYEPRTNILNSDETIEIALNNEVSSHGFINNFVNYNIALPQESLTHINGCIDNTITNRRW